MLKLFETLKRVADPKARLIAADLARLDEVEAGLGKVATAYVVDGHNETVLATLANKCSGKELDVCARYFDLKSPARQRRQFFHGQAGQFPEITVRYVEVLAACVKQKPDYVRGCEATHVPTSIFFTELYLGVMAQLRPQDQIQAEKALKAPLTADMALTMTSRLGGGVIDLLDVLFAAVDGYERRPAKIMREAIGDKELTIQYAEEFCAAAKRGDAATRAAMAKAVVDFGLAAMEPFRGLLLSLVGDGAKSVRESAGAALKVLTPEQIEPFAIEQLKQGNVNFRLGMVSLLGHLGTDAAMAALVEHRQVEKTARVNAAIDAIQTTAQQVSEPTGPEEGGFTAIDGGWVEVPPLAPIPPATAPVFGGADKELLLAKIRAENDASRERHREHKKRGYRGYLHLLDEKLATQAVDLLNGKRVGSVHYTVRSFLSWGIGEPWARQALAQLPDAQALKVCSLVCDGLASTIGPYANGVFAERVHSFLESGRGDLRHLEQIDIENKVEMRFGYQQEHKSTEAGDYLRNAIKADYGYDEPVFKELPSHATWPYLADQFHVFDEAFGLVPPNRIKLSAVQAIEVLSVLPEPPQRYFGQLLEAAVSETKRGRQEARDMLAAAADVEPHIINMLDDSRQAIRAGAAEWLRQRQSHAAIPAMEKRLAREKSELARAAILTTLKEFGVDLSTYVGPEALLGEAEKGLKKAKFDKLAWLQLEHMPPAHYRSGEVVPGEVLRWWIFLANKLKQPGGNGLFDIYLEQLDPADAQRFSTWIMDSWYNYDTARPSEEDGNAHAEKNASRVLQAYLRWYKDYTREQAFAMLKRDFMSTYLNSGAAHKGLLALAKYADPVIAADRARVYLKNHGSRTSQASSMLEMLAAIGNPVALQVLIAAATRLKQKGVQEFAGKLIAKVAQQNNWSFDELADRTVPSAGLDEDGLLLLPCGPDAKDYAASIGDGFTLELRNPSGKVVKSLPSGGDDATKAARKQLSASRKELKQVVSMQSARLYEALCSGREWQAADWQRDVAEHPIMRKLAERMVWVGLDAERQVVDLFRPTPEGDLTNADDEDVDLAGFHGVKIAHGATLDAETSAQWQSHLSDYEVEPIIEQFGRSLLTLEAEQGDQDEINDREGWVTDTFTIRGVATKLGYERGEAQDAGFFDEYSKSFQSAGVVAVVRFSGNCLPEENLPAATIALTFHPYRNARRTNSKMKLSEVPPVLLSECWNDYRAMAAKGAFEEKWQEKMPWSV